MRAVVLSVVLGATSACSSVTVLVRGEGESIAALRALPSEARPRIAVLPVLDRTPPYGGRSLSLALALLNMSRRDGAPIGGNSLLESCRTLLTTELVQSGAFTVLEREDLPAIVAEQVFAESAERVVPATMVQAGALEGAQYLLAAALTTFDTGSEGAALPIPIPVKLGEDAAALGILNLGYKKQSVSMDLRLIDARTGRVVQTMVVDGSQGKAGMQLTGIGYAGPVGIFQIPKLLDWYRNTPMEVALQEMSLKAVQAVAKAVQPAPSSRTP